MADPRELLDSYFSASDVKQRQLRATKQTDAAARVLLKHLVPVRYRDIGPWFSPT